MQTWLMQSWLTRLHFHDISVCLVKQVYEHDKFLVFLKKYMDKINPISMEPDYKTKKMASPPASSDR